jgi:beta-lactamase regulating signal transducer with metallopeptidase domain
MYARGSLLNINGCTAMPEGLWPIIILIVVVIAWVLSKVRYYMRKSEEQWREVDKTKLREWEDEDD